MEASRIEAALRAFFAGAPADVLAAWLFGSTARGTARQDSDVDVAVLRASPQPKGFAGLPLGLEGDIERLVRREVQVIDMAGAPPDLIHRVLTDGHLLLDRSPSQRIRFEVKARNEYFDVLPFLRRYRRTG